MAVSLPGSLEEAVAERVKSALHGGGFILYGQAIVPLSGGGPQRPFREILIRFREEEVKMLPPGAFFPILQENGLLPELDRWVVSALAQRSRAARDENPAVLLPRNNINLSTETLHDANFVKHVSERVAAANLPPGTISFELPWSATVENTRLVQELMVPLKLAGCDISIAGFDGSPEAFYVVSALRPDFVKLGYGLARNLSRSLANAEHAEAVNSKCHDLGIQTIAEHVEEQAVLEHLRIIQVDYVQGLIISPPEPL